MRDRELSRMKRKWQVALATGLALMGLMYVPLYIDTMDWLMPAIFVVATVVQFWAGKDLYASAWAAAKHRSTNMTTLVALGTGVAYGYSTFVTLWPGLAESWGLPLHVYYETSLIIVALVLAGSSAAIRGGASRHQTGHRARCVHRSGDRARRTHSCCSGPSARWSSSDSRCRRSRRPW